MTNLETHIYDWVFNYNIYTQTWQAVKREYYQELFNGGSHVLRSSNILTLIAVINKTDGDVDKIKALTNKQTQIETNGKSDTQLHNSSGGTTTADEVPQTS